VFGTPSIPFDFAVRQAAYAIHTVSHCFERVTRSYNFSSCFYITRKIWKRKTKICHLFPTFMCMIRKTTPRTMQIEPTTRYPIPRNGFFPPSHDVVVSTILFLPLNDDTGYAACKRNAIVIILYYSKRQQKITHTKLWNINIRLVTPEARAH